MPDPEDTAHTPLLGPDMNSVQLADSHTKNEKCLEFFDLARKLIRNTVRQFPSPNEKNEKCLDHN